MVVSQATTIFGGVALGALFFGALAWPFVRLSSLRSASSGSLLARKVQIVRPVGKKHGPKHFQGPASFSIDLICPSKGHKHECFLDGVRDGKVDLDAFVIFADDDIIFNNWSEDRIISIFESFESKIVMGAERALWPNCSMWKDFAPRPIYQDKYPNSGFIMGKTEHLVDMFRWTINNTSPQPQDEDDDGAKPDMLRVQRYWIHHRGSPGEVALDSGSLLVKNLLDWMWWHRVPREKFRSPWYLSKCRPVASAWTRYPPPCANPEQHALYVRWDRNLDCSSLYRVKGCTIRQRRIANRTVTREEEMRVIAKGDWQEELDDFLPAQESLAHHGNGWGTYPRLLLRFGKTCVPTQVPHTGLYRGRQ